MITHSAIYEGTVRHRRYKPIEREFKYSLSMFYIDLEEVDRVLAMHPLFSRRRRGPASFLRSDFFGPGGPSGCGIREAVAGEVTRQTGWTPDGPIRLLTNLRQWGVLANPVSFYYCFDGATGKLRAVLAEVTNTPWGDQQSYVIPAGKGGSRVLRGSFEKAMHVSPLMSMNQVHEIWAGEPGESLSVYIANHESGEVVLDATLNLKHKELTRRRMNSLVALRPPMPLKVLAGIYTQAARLLFAGVPFYSRPEGGHISEKDHCVDALPSKCPEAMIKP